LKKLIFINFYLPLHTSVTL